MRRATRHNSKENIVEVISGRVCPIMQVLHVGKSQLAAIMCYKEAEIVLEVMDVDLQISGSDCNLHAAATVYELCAQLALRCLEREAIKSFPRKGQRPSGIVRASIQTPFFASAMCQKDGQRTWLGASNVVNGTTKPAPTSLKQFFSRKREPWPVKTVNRRDCSMQTIMMKVCSLLYMIVKGTSKDV